MSAAADATAGAPPAKGGKKKLIIIIVAAVLLLGGGGGAFLFMKKKAAAEAAAAEEEGGGSAAHAPAHKADAGHPPTFVPLEPFVVNLADKEVDKYAQIGITLEIDDPKFAEEIKAYMPAIRNGILMVLAHKTSQQLLEREGKLALADEIMRESVRPMGIETDDEDDAEAVDTKPKKKRKKKATVHNPVQKVHFSNFIIQ